MSRDISDNIQNEGIRWHADYDRAFTAILDNGETVAVDSEGYAFPGLIAKARENAGTGAAEEPKGVLESAFPSFDKDTRERSKKALIGKQTVGLLAAAAVSDDSEAVGRVAERLINSIEQDTGPLHIPGLEDAPQNVQAMKVAAELAGEVKTVAKDESVQILKDRLAELQGLVDTDKKDLADQNKRLEQENRRLTRELEAVRRNSTDHIATLNERIELLNDQLAEENQAQAPVEQAEALEPEEQPEPLQRKKMLGFGAVGVAFRHHFARPSQN